MDFFTAKEIDASMKKKIEAYIDEIKDKDFDELIDKDWQSNEIICPFCRTQYPDYTYFLKHFRFYKHRWELKLLERIYNHGPRNLKVFDVFYPEKEDGELYSKVKLWVLSMKIFEYLNMLPFWKNNKEFKTRDYIKRIFWKKDKKAKQASKNP